jgi:hypothetical protein
MDRRLYQGDHCPCPSDCQRRGRCKECIAFHHGRSEPTYCEYLYGEAAAPPPTPERAMRTGKQIRMLDYAPCAG